MASQGKWIKSRWEETRKDNGTYRSRWVLQEFANKNAEGDFFSATPDAYDIDLVHIQALIEEHEIRYLDYTREFLHAPEMEMIFTDPPAGFE